MPEFDKTGASNLLLVLVFDNDNVKYDITLGTNLLSKTGFKSSYSEGSMEWFDYSILLRPPGGLDSNKFNTTEHMFHIQVKNEIFGEDWLKSFATEILGAKYKKTDVAEVMKGLNHLDAHQLDLSTIGKQKDVWWNSWCSTTWKDFQRKTTEYAGSATHINWTKSKDVSWNSWCLSTWIDFQRKTTEHSTSRQLNKVKRHKKYLLLIITDILRKHSRYEFFTKLGNSMQYYMFKLDNKSQDSCTIITPFGKYKYLRLLMGLKCSPDIA